MEPSWNDRGTLRSSDRFFAGSPLPGYENDVPHAAVVRASTAPAVAHRAPIRAGLALLGVLAVVSGCANAPAYRPVGPPMGTAGFEAGAGVHGVVGEDVAGVGTAAWMTGQVARDIMLVARGHFTDLIPYQGGAGVFRDIQYGGGAGFRGLYALKPDLLLAGEVTLDYLEERNNGTVKRFVSGIASFPVAEEAFTDFWVYVQPSIGAGFRFGDVAPFAGFTEVPIGIAWKPAPWATVVVEGGFAIPFNGGYLGVAGAFRL